MSVRDTIRASRPRPFTVDTPAGPITVRPLNGRRRDEYIQSLLKKGRLSQCEQAAWAIWDDETDQLAYNADNPADIAELHEMDGAVLGQIVNSFLVESGIVEKSVEDAEKKSEPSPSASSGSS
jgi:hypothetical protein